jgi:acyl-CoA reductase-like NAD-dependent aldehyde dehydrogenase
MTLGKALDGSPIVPLWIDGRSLPIDSDRLIKVYSSVSGELVHFAQSSNVNEAVQAADSSWKAFLRWRMTTASTRRDILLRVADIYERRIDELTQYQIEETSCSEDFARFNIRYAQQGLREIASRISSISGLVPQMESKDTWALVLREPIGPVLAIPP